MKLEFTKVADKIAEAEPTDPADDDQKKELLDKAIGLELQKTIVIFDEFVQYLENCGVDQSQ